MKCPHDHAEINATRASDIGAHQCPAFQGLWIESAALQQKDPQLLRATRRKFSELRCPAGCGTLVEIGYQGLYLDLCPKCRGVWFDAGEIERALAARGPAQRRAGSEHPSVMILMDFAGEAAGQFFDSL